MSKTDRLIRAFGHKYVTHQLVPENVKQTLNMIITLKPAYDKQTHLDVCKYFIYVRYERYDQVPEMLQLLDDIPYEELLPFRCCYHS